MISYRTLVFGAVTVLAAAAPALPASADSLVAAPLAIRHSNDSLVAAPLYVRQTPPALSSHFSMPGAFMETFIRFENMLLRFI